MKCHKIHTRHPNHFHCKSQKIFSYCNAYEFETGTIVQKKEEELVIPLISKNNWRTSDKKEKNLDEKKIEKEGKNDEQNLTIKQLAARELIEDSKRQLEVEF